MTYGRPFMRKAGHEWVDRPTARPSAERRVYVHAPPRVVWAALHDPAHFDRLYPELTLESADPAWPAAASSIRAVIRLGWLRERVRIESLEARPEMRFRLHVTGSSFRSDWTWRLEPTAGGTRVIHYSDLGTDGPVAALLIRFGRETLADRVESHLAALKERAEAGVQVPHTVPPSVVVHRDA
jgi:carbon monoxide dehydrogenase subunit G